uniref:ATP synthase F0 subunit 8 n=1 Tax=Ledropsis sp. 1 XYW-2023a TaxID=3078463 RepID=A0AB38ZHA8_9HEMI
MPQMCPLWWFFLFIFFLIFLYFLVTLIYFYGFFNLFGSKTDLSVNHFFWLW